MSEDKTQRRYKFVFGFLTICVGLVIFQYARVMLSGGPQGNVAGNGERQVERGPILDRNGRILAIQTRLNTVTVWTPDLANLAETADQLASILDLDAPALLEQFKGANGFLVVKRTVTPTQSERIQELIDAGQLQGVTLRPDTGRTYPEGTLAANVIGYVGIDNTGLDGIEYTFDPQLSPAPSSATSGTTYGDQIFLTLDVNIQNAMDDLARTAFKENDADSVMLLVMNSQSGEILSYSSIPTFDPNHFDTYSVAERKNLPIAKVYEPGSVFKIFSISSFLELGGITPSDHFNTSGGYVDRQGGFTIKDLGDYGRIDPEQIIKYSSNVGAAYASQTVTADSFYHMLRLYGFGAQTGVALNGEEQGLLKTPDSWSGRTQQTMAFGQEIGVTALQVITAATVFANDGVLLRPHIVKKIVSPTGELIQEYKRQPVREVLSAKTAHTMLSFMHSATQPGGTAHRIRIDGLDISAKTGTAEVFNSRLGEYSKKDFIASCLAIFPTENPRLIVYLVIEHPRGKDIYGGRIAVPVVRDAAQFLVPYLGIHKEGDTVIEHDGRVTVSEPSLPQITDTIPDLTGLPKRTLLPLLAREDLQVEIEGNGWVVRQNPPPGTAFSPGMTLRLELQ